LIKATKQDETNSSFEIKVDDADRIMELKSQFNFKYG